MWEISYKNLNFWHLSDLAVLGGIPMWEGGWVLPCLDESWACQDTDPN